MWNRLNNEPAWHCTQLNGGMRKQHLFWTLTNGQTHSPIVDALCCDLTIFTTRKNSRSTLMLHANVGRGPSLRADVTGSAARLLLSRLST